MPKPYIITQSARPAHRKVGKGALAGHHPQHLGATVLKALAERNDLKHRRWWTTSLAPRPSAASRAPTGRMAALDGRLDVRRLGRHPRPLLRSGITAVNLAAAQIMSGMEECDRRRDRDDVIQHSSPPTRATPTKGPCCWISGNLRLRARHPQSNQGICADAIATMKDFARGAGRARFAQPAARRPAIRKRALRTSR